MGNCSRICQCAPAWMQSRSWNGMHSDGRSRPFTKSSSPAAVPKKLNSEPRTARESHRHPDHPELENLLDHHAQSNAPRRRTDRGVHGTRSISSRRTRPEQGLTSRSTLTGHYIVKLARLGGYLARAHDPPPGNTVIWRGLSRLTRHRTGHHDRSATCG